MQSSIVNFKYIDLGDRIDAEYFQPNYLHIEELLIKRNSIPLSSFCNITGSAFYPAATQLYEYGDMPFIRCVDCIDYPTITKKQNNLFEKIPTSFADEYKNVKRLRKGEIVITKVGTPCFASIVHDIDEVALSRTVLGIKKIKNIDPYYLLAFLRSKYGFLQLFRERELTIQFQLTLSRVGKVLIYKPINSSIESLISKYIKEYEVQKNKSEILFNQAQLLLLSELGLESWKPKHKLSFVKNYSATEEARRIDAEYFQPKYDEIVVAIKKYKGGWNTIGNQFKLNKTTFKKTDGKKYNYLEISGVNVADGQIEPIEIDASELPTNAKIKLKKDDLIISKVRTYRGAVAIIERDDLIGSGAFTVLQENGTILKETMFILLKSLPFSQYSLKFNTGTSYPTIIDNDILNYPVPLFDDEIQNIVKEKVLESANLRQKSKALFEIVKKGVELAIEKDEATAEKCIKSEVSKLGVSFDA